MPERLYEYRIWFEESNVATIINGIENEGYGKLDKEYAQILKDSLYNK